MAISRTRAVSTCVELHPYIESWTSERKTGGGREGGREGGGRTGGREEGGRERYDGRVLNTIVHQKLASLASTIKHKKLATYIVKIRSPQCTSNAVSEDFSGSAGLPPGIIIGHHSITQQGPYGTYCYNYTLHLCILYCVL